MGNREIDLTFRFHAQGLQENVADTPSLRTAAAKRIAPGPGRSVGVDEITRELFVGVLLAEVVNPAIWMEALKHPVVGTDGLSHGPPPILLTVGRLLTARCVVTQSTLNWKEPLDPDTLLPFAAEVQVTFTVVRTKILGNLFKHGRVYT